MISFTPLSPLFGAATADVDLSRPLAEDDFRAIERAFYAHQVIALRGQRITAAQFAALARRIGPPQPHGAERVLAPAFAAGTM